MEWIRQIGRLVLLLALQVLLFNHLQIAGWCFPMVYVLFLINLPAQLPRWGEMLIGFVVGLLMDVWFNSLGVHIAACVAIGFLRPLLLSNLVQEIERVKDDVCSRSIGRVEYIKCAVLLTVIHHFIVFSLEAWSLQNWWVVLLQTVVSSAMTLVVILGYDFLKK